MTWKSAITLRSKVVADALSEGELCEEDSDDTMDLELCLRVEQLDMSIYSY